MKVQLRKSLQREPQARSYRESLLTTLRLMRQYMVEGAASPVVIELAGRIVADADVFPAHYSDRYRYDLDRLRAIYDWTRANIAYVSDGTVVGDGPVRQREVQRDVEVVLRGRAGDCNDQTALVGALILASFDPVRLNGRTVPPVEVWILCAPQPVHVFPVALLPAAHKTVVRPQLARQTGQAGVHKIVVDTAGRPGRRFGELPGNGSPSESFQIVSDFFA